MSPPTSAPVVLVIDDDASVRYTLRAIIEDEGVAVEEAADGRAGLERVAAGGIALVITDMTMPVMDGMKLLDALAERPNAPGAVMITANGSERVAVEAMKRGALDYLAKPFDAEEVARVVRRTVLAQRLEEENRRLRAELSLRNTMEFQSDAMGRVAQLVERIGPRDMTVLVTGETGTGKELVARALVRASRRADRPYVRFSCAGLTRELAESELFGHTRGAFTGATKARLGLFREAQGGTLLLDEIGELDLQVQGSLLRVLQEREIRPVGAERTIALDVRVIAATHQDLRAEVAAGRFRQDLLYRLDVVTVHVPPLRERGEDIALLARHFVDRFANRFGLGDVRLSAALIEQLQARTWPGNVRELEHAIERLVALCNGGVIDVDQEAHGLSTPPGSTQREVALTLKERVGAFERGLIAAELRRCSGNQSATARSLGVSRVTLLDKMKKYGLR